MSSSSSAAETPICECGDPECPGRVTYTWPFKINAEATDGTLEGMIGYFSVRTSSHDWGGERTDLHDLLSLLLALLLRVRDIASSHLIAELNSFSGIDSEIYARLIAFRQEGSLASMAGRAYFDELSAVSRAAHDMVLDVFGVAAAGPADWRDGDACYRAPPAWVDAIRRRLRLPTVEGWEFNHRTAFDAKVFTSVKRGVSVAEIGEERMTRLRHWVKDFRPAYVEGPTRTSFRSRLLVNAIHNDRLKEARALLAKVEPSSNTIIIPLDSHFLLLGRTALLAMASSCGADAYQSERIATEVRREAEADVFLQDVDVIWAEKLDDGRFEELVGELLTRERGVQRVRQVGSTREADDGRDLVVEWALSPNGLFSEGVTDGSAPFLERREVVVQVKIRSKGVGRSHLPGLRDTMDHHGCSGLLVVAYPNVTAKLTDHLTALRRDQRYWVDWWGRLEIERRLRRHPEIAARFSDLVTLHRP